MREREIFRGEGTTIITKQELKEIVKEYNYYEKFNF